MAQNIFQFVFCLQLLPLSCFLLPVIAAYATYILVPATFTIVPVITSNFVHVIHRTWRTPIRQSHRRSTRFRGSMSIRTQVGTPKRILTSRGLLRRRLQRKQKRLVLRNLRQTNQFLHCHPINHPATPTYRLRPDACPTPGVLLSYQDDAEALPCSPIAAQDPRIVKSSLSPRRHIKCGVQQQRDYLQFSQEATTKRALQQACYTFQATKVAHHPYLKPTRFDYESYPIGIDNHASRCISNCIDDFASTIKPSKRQLIGISGSLDIKGTGTVKWVIEDDDGVRHHIHIPNTLYVPDAPMRLLSPQHWSQTANDNSPSPNGTWCATYHDSLVLHWNQNKYHRTIMLNPERNTAVINTAPSIKQFMTFSALHSMPDTDLVLRSSRDQVYDEKISHPLQELVPIQKDKTTTSLEFVQAPV